MKTDSLIAALAADTLPQKSVSAHLARAIPVALALSFGAVILLWGVRSDIWQALGSYAVLKSLGPLVLAGLALPIALALAHPGVRPARLWLGLGAAIALVLGVFVIAFVGSGWSGLLAALSAPSAAVCLFSIPALALPLLTAGLWAMSSGAVLRPGLTGALVGLAAGALAASTYSLYCDKDMVLFVVPAYAAGIMSVVLAGTLLGPRVLKW